MDASDNQEKEVLTELLKVYKTHEVLWDSSHTFYHNKSVRNQVYHSLLEVYRRIKPRATVKDLKKKIENMRSTYKKELKKVKESAGAKEAYIPTLWYYELMLFLDQKDVVQPGVVIWKNEEESSTNEYKEDTEDDDLEEFQNPNDFLNPLNYELSPSEIPASNPAPNTSRNLSSSTTIPRTPKRAKVSLRINQEELMDAASPMLKGAGNQSDTFGTSVGQQLQMLKPTQQAIAQKLISDVLFFGKFDQLSPTASVLPTAQTSFIPTPAAMCHAGTPPNLPPNKQFSHPYISFHTSPNQFYLNPNCQCGSSQPISNQGSLSTSTAPSPSPRINPPESFRDSSDSPPSEEHADCNRRNQKSDEDMSENPHLN